MPAKHLLIVRLGEQPPLDLPTLAPTDWEATVVEHLPAAHQALLHRHYPVGLLLVGQDQTGALAAMDVLLGQHRQVQWVGVFAAQTVCCEGYRELVVQHLFDFHTLPMDMARLLHTLGHAHGYADLLARSEAACLLPPVAAPPSTEALIGHSPAIARLRRQIARVAQVKASVLIWGESGSGKELVARAIHQQSPRAAGRFVALNCAAVPDGLVQSELFGHARGAFTGALRERPGLIETAAGGTLFLDEVGDLRLALQANLLRFLQEGTISRVGSTRSLSVDARVIAASHVHLEDAVRAGRFREDLLYRLNVLPLRVPALRERKEDVALLTRHVFLQYGAERNPRLRGFSNRAMRAMQQHDWPGNVRELINRVRRAMVMAEGRLITPDDLGLQGALAASQGEALEHARQHAECDAIRECLQSNGHNKTRAARKLGVSRMTLYRLMQRHGIGT